MAYSLGWLSNSPNLFTSTFTATANPINPAVWDGGATVGLDWLDFKSASNVACAGAFSANPAPPYNDAMAILKQSVFACAADQYVEWTISRAGGYNPPGTHELGAFLRFTLGAHSAAGYEAYLNHASNFTIVRWNGALNDFTPISSTGPGPSAPANGDVNRFQIQGSTLKYYQNGVLVATATDTTFATGQAGLQSFCISTSTPTSYGMSSVRIGNL